MSRNFYSTLLGIVLVFAGHSITKAQNSTFTEVYNIFQAKCTFACHSGSNPTGLLDLSGTEQEVYARLVGIDAANPHAATAGQKLVRPGYPKQSFLMQKVSYGLDPELDLTDQAQGNPMPNNNPLQKHEAELIRQWILFGARDTGVVIEPQILVDYYQNGLGLEEIITPRTPEQEGYEGYQVRIGPMFLEPLEEIEYFLKQEVGLPHAKEVYRLDGFMNEESHHYALFDMDPVAAQYQEDGLYVANGISEVSFVHLHSTLLGAWQYDRNMELPENSAFFWDENSVLAVNYHVLNYSTDSILKADAFINIYTRDTVPETREIVSVVDQLGHDFPWVLKIPPMAQGELHTESFFYRKPGEIWDIWSFQAHTHSWGRDYDVYLVNPDSTIGEQVYEGHYDPSYTFLQPSYDYAHPPTRTWDDEFLTVNMDYGFYVEAKYANTSSDTVGFGFTTSDEMFAFYLHYLDHVEDSSNTDGITELSEVKLTAYPNPMVESAVINVSHHVQLDDAELQIHDMMGKMVRKESGINSNSIRVKREDLPTGVYVYSLFQNGTNIGTGKLIMK